MNDSQKHAFWTDMQTEYHNTDFQRRLQDEDAAAGKDVRKSKKSRWNRECQRRGGTPQMWQLRSFSGRGTESHQSDHRNTLEVDEGLTYAQVSADGEQNG